MNRVEFTYDALGRRLSKLAGEYSHWVWNGNVPLARVELQQGMEERRLAEARA